MGWQKSIEQDHDSHGSAVKLICTNLWRKDSDVSPSLSGQKYSMEARDVWV